MQDLLNFKTDITHIYIFYYNKVSVVVHEMTTNVWENNVFQFVCCHNDRMRYLVIFLRKDSVNSISYGTKYLDYSSILYIFHSKALVHLITSYLVSTTNFFFQPIATEILPSGFSEYKSTPRGKGNSLFYQTSEESKTKTKLFVQVYSPLQSTKGKLYTNSTKNGRFWFQVLLLLCFLQFQFPCIRFLSRFNTSYFLFVLQIILLLHNTKYSRYLQRCQLTAKPDVSWRSRQHPIQT